MCAPFAGKAPVMGAVAVKRCGYDFSSPECVDRRIFQSYQTNRPRNTTVLSHGNRPNSASCRTSLGVCRLNFVTSLQLAALHHLRHTSHSLALHSLGRLRLRQTHVLKNTAPTWSGADWKNLFYIFIIFIYIYQQYVNHSL